MGKTIYLAYYGTEKHPRNVAPAAVTMAQYIIQSLSKVQSPLIVLSPAQAVNKIYYGRELVREQQTEVIFLPSYPFQKHNILMRGCNKIRRQRDLKGELLSQLKDGDTLIVYHSLGLIDVVTQVKKKLKIRLVVQVCEVYADVLNNDSIRKKEFKFFQLADAYIFSSSLLQEKINKSRKKYVICLGTYYTELDRGIKFNDGKIHVVYAGTFDKRKGGAIAAVTAGEFLPENYHLHIIGQGQDSDLKYLLEKIDEVSKKSQAIITYDGLKKGEEYIRFIQSCDIGLSTQNPDAAFNETSFPSKVLSYLANGLRVVSIRIKALEESAVNDLLFYYDENSPQEIAEAVKAVRLDSDYDSRKRIKNLDLEFIRALGNLLGAKYDFIYKESY